MIWVSIIFYKSIYWTWTQRDRLGLYLTDTKAITDKIAVERLIADIDFKLIGVIEKMNYNEVRIWQAVVKQMNKVVEEKKLNVRIHILIYYFVIVSLELSWHIISAKMVLSLGKLFRKSSTVPLVFTVVL